MTDVLIIEDDISVAHQLKYMIEQAGGDFRICHMLHSVKDSRVWLMQNKMPRLIFCDIQLSDGLGFEIFRDMTVAAPVIFCATYQDFALEAFENNGIDYLLKPYDKTRLQKSLNKFSQLRELFGEDIFF